MNKFIGIICGLLMVNFVFGQTDSTATVPELPGDEVEVIKDFQARLAEAKMLRLIPQAPVVQVKELAYDYNVEIRKLELEYLPPTIRPVALPAPEAEKVRNTMMSFGYGYPRLSEGYLASDYEFGKMSVGVNYKHLASSHRERLPSGFYRNDGLVQLGYDFGKGTSARVAVDVGFDKNEILNGEDSLRNDRYDNRYGFLVGLGKTRLSESPWSYDAYVKYSRFQVRDLVLTSFGENNVDVGIYAEYVKDFWRGRLDMRLMNSSSNADSLSSYTGFLVEPEFVYGIGDLRIKAGLSMLWDSDVKFYPQVEARYSVVGDLLVGRMFAETRFKRNTHEATYEYNPFIETLGRYGVEREMQFGLGIGGRSEKWTYGLDVYYCLYDDIQTYARKEGVADRVYEVNMGEGRGMNVRMQGRYEIMENIGVGTGIQYRNMRDSIGNKLSGYYDVEWDVNGDMKLLNDKLRVGVGAVVLLLNEGNVEEGNGNFIDLGLDAEYELFRDVRVFVKGDNLLNRRNARWDGYDALGISVMGGVKVVF